MRKIVYILFGLILVATSGCFSDNPQGSNNVSENAKRQYQEYFDICMERLSQEDTSSQFAQECVKKGGCYTSCGSGCGHTTPETFDQTDRVCPAVCREDCLESL